MSDGPGRVPGRSVAVERGAGPLGTWMVSPVRDFIDEADRTARLLLMDVERYDAGRLLGAWPSVVAAAHTLWRSLPEPADADAAVPDAAMSQLGEVAGGIGRSLRRAGWSSTTQADLRVVQIIERFHHAHDLVCSYRAPLRSTGRDVRSARLGIMHVLYLTAHATGLALRLDERMRLADRPDAHRSRQGRMSHAPAPVEAWIHRIATCETIAGRYLSARPGATSLRGRCPLGDSSRLARALVRVDVEAHRTLATESWRKELVLIARTQSLIARATGVLVGAAKTAGRPSQPDRLSPALAEAGRAWNNLADRWTDLAPPSASPGSGLVAAAAEVRAAYREITHDHQGLASPGTIAGAPGFSCGAEASLHAIETSPDLAYLVAEKADAPDLTGLAHAMAARALADNRAGLVPAEKTGDVVWISPAAIVARQVVPAPHPIIEGLRSAGREIVRYCNRTSSMAVVSALSLEL